MAGSAALDLDENAERMSEPELWVVTALLAAYGFTGNASYTQLERSYLLCPRFLGLLYQIVVQQNS